MKLRWLEWSTIDLERGLGGVEVHARSLARELEQAGHEVVFSRDPSDLTGEWDVIHTHGSAPAPESRTYAIRVHTLHGSTLGRMAACGEWAWIGGYAAAVREFQGVRSADVVMSVHPRTPLYLRALKQEKTAGVCWNGWDASDLPGVAAELAPELVSKLNSLGDFWIFVGRGGDRMKGADRLRAALPLLEGVKWVAAPGAGFEDVSSFTRTGALSSAQVRELMKRAAGLVLPSRYEGHSLVLLEALAQGLPCVATRVGGVDFLPEGVEGLISTDSADPRAIADGVRAAQKLDRGARDRRTQKNRSLLPNWAAVTRIYLDAVRRFRETRGGA